MKRLYFALAVFIALVAIVGIGTYTVKTDIGKMMKTFEKIETAVNQNDIQTAKKLVDTAEKDWIKYEKRLKLYINHADVCDVGLSITGLKPFLEEDEIASFMSEFKKARVQLLHISSLEVIDSE